MEFECWLVVDVDVGYVFFVFFVEFFVVVDVYEVDIDCDIYFVCDFVNGCFGFVVEVIFCVCVDDDGDGVVYCLMLLLWFVEFFCCILLDYKFVFELGLFEFLI